MSKAENVGVFQSIFSIFPEVVFRPGSPVNNLWKQYLQSADSTAEESNLEQTENINKYPTTLYSALGPNIHTYVSEQLPADLQRKQGVAWVDLVQVLHIREAFVGGQTGNHLPIKLIEDDAERNLILTPQMSLGIYRDPELFQRIIWSFPYEGSDMFSSGYLKYQMRSKYAGGVTALQLQANRDRTHYAVNLTQRNFDFPDPIFKFTGIFDREGNQLPV